MATSDSSLTDADGRFVVDPRKAANGLDDPLSEPVGAYSTISAALSVAPADATIMVRPGAYVEQLMITRPVRLLADAGAELTWKSDKPYEAALTVAIADSQPAGDVLVSGLRISHSSPSIAQNYAVYVPQPSSASADKARIEIRDCDVSSATGSGVGVEGGDVTLARCRIANCKNHGVSFLGPTARGAVLDCTIEKAKLNGVLLRDGASPTLRGNRLRSNGQFGAALFDCRGTLEDNEASGNGKGSVSGECDDF